MIEVSLYPAKCLLWWRQQIFAYSNAVKWYLQLFPFHLQVVVNELWLSRGISSAVDYPRVHHQLFPDTVMIEKPPYTISQSIQDGLRARKHNISEEAAFAVVQAVVTDKDKEIYGKCDPRKYGWPDGF